MIQNYKEILLKELSARMPYGLKVNCKLKDEDYLFTFDEKHMGVGALYTDYYGNPLESPDIILSGCYYGDDIKPYLFPLSSMTEEQWKEYQTIKMTDLVEGDINGVFINAGTITDWLNKHHFDYRGLIEKGLAIDATGLDIYNR